MSIKVGWGGEWGIRTDIELEQQRNGWTVGAGSAQLLDGRGQGKLERGID